MQHIHRFPSTTHTVEMDQIAELSSGLREHARIVRASELGLQGAELPSRSRDGRSGLPGDAVLVRISFDGPPQYPYVHAHFRASPGDPGSLTVDLHTDALRRLSRLLGLQHAWGAGVADSAKQARY